MNNSMEIKSVDFVRYDNDQYDIYINIGEDYIPFRSPFIVFSYVNITKRPLPYDNLLEIAIYKDRYIATFRLPSDVCNFIDFNEVKHDRI